MMWAEVSCHLCWRICGLVGAMFQAKPGCCLWQSWNYLMGVTMQVEIGCHLCQPWGHLSRVQGTLRPASACLGFWAFGNRELGTKRKLGKVFSISRTRLLVWRSHWKMFDWVQELVKVGSQGITKIRQTVLTWLVESSDLVPCCVRLAG